MSIFQPLKLDKQPLAPKAPDAFVCPKCHSSEAVFVDRDRNLQSGFTSAFWSFFFCRNCDRTFSKVGRTIVIPFVYLAGLLFLVFFNFNRY